MRSGRRGYTKEQVLAAIEGSGGIMSAVAKRLGCDWNTAKKYVSRWVATRAAFRAEREKVLDLAETTLLKSIKDGDAASAKWMLSRLGRHRGYVERQEIEPVGDKPILVVVRPSKEQEDESN